MDDFPEYKHDDRNRIQGLPLTGFDELTPKDVNVNILNGSSCHGYSTYTDRVYLQTDAKNQALNPHFSYPNREPLETDIVNEISMTRQNFHCNGSTTHQSIVTREVSSLDSYVCENTMPMPPHCPSLGPPVFMPPPGSATSSAVNINEARSDCSLSDRPLRVYPAVLISPGGLITVLLDKDIAVEMTMDRAIRIVNNRHRSVAAVNRLGDLCCIHHQSAKIYHDGTVTEAAIYWQRNVRMCSEGIVFAYGVPCFLLSPTHGLMQTSHSFQDLSRDMSVTVLFTSRGYGPHLVELLEALVRNAQYDYQHDGGVTVEINKCIIKQAASGEVTVTCEDNDKFLRVSPDSGSTWIETSFCEMSVQMNYNVKIKRGSFRMHASYNGMIVSDGIHDSGFTASRRPFLRPVVMRTETIIKHGKRVDHLSQASGLMDNFKTDQDTSCVYDVPLSRLSGIRRRRRQFSTYANISSTANTNPMRGEYSNYLESNRNSAGDNINITQENETSDTTPKSRNRGGARPPSYRGDPYKYWIDQLNTQNDNKTKPRRQLRFADEAAEAQGEGQANERKNGANWAEETEGNKERDEVSRTTNQGRFEPHLSSSTYRGRYSNGSNNRRPQGNYTPNRPYIPRFARNYKNYTWTPPRRPKRLYKLGRAHVYPPPGTDENTKKRFSGYIEAATSEKKDINPRRSKIQTSVSDTTQGRTKDVLSMGDCERNLQSEGANGVIEISTRSNTKTHDNDKTTTKITETETEQREAASTSRNNLITESDDLPDVTTSDIESRIENIVTQINESKADCGSVSSPGEENDEKTSMEELINSYLYNNLIYEIRATENLKPQKEPAADRSGADATDHDALPESATDLITNVLAVEVVPKPTTAEEEAFTIECKATDVIETGNNKPETEHDSTETGQSVTVFVTTSQESDDELMGEIQSHVKAVINKAIELAEKNTATAESTLSHDEATELVEKNTATEQREFSPDEEIDIKHISSDMSMGYACSKPCERPLDAKSKSLPYLDNLKDEGNTVQNINKGGARKGDNIEQICCPEGAKTDENSTEAKNKKPNASGEGAQGTAEMKQDGECAGKSPQKSGGSKAKWQGKHRSNNGRKKRNLNQ